MEQGRFLAYASNEKHPDWSKHIRREEELYKRNNDIRSEYERDYTRILHCLAPSPSLNAIEARTFQRNNTYGLRGREVSFQR